MNIIDNIKLAGLQLPELSTPGGSYSSVNIRGAIAYVAIQFPILNEEFLYQGKLGNELSTEDGYEAFKLCALNVIAQIHGKIGFDSVIGLNHMDAYYVANNNWDDAPIAVNGASDLFNQILVEAGTHSRAILGLDNLPRNFCAGIVTSFTIKNH